ncbi:hypothetical protein ABW20_dc0110143 [Dactylellina cionopaga]|nr:hypothetical protein ABW20_dc0110143 [Dactylellina cionopaga]
MVITNQRQLGVSMEIARDAGYQIQYLWVRIPGEEIPPAARDPSMVASIVASDQKRTVEAPTSRPPKRDKGQGKEESPLEGKSDQGLGDSKGKGKSKLATGGISDQKEKDVVPLVVLSEASDSEAVPITLKSPRKRSRPDSDEDESDQTSGLDKGQGILRQSYEDSVTPEPTIPPTGQPQKKKRKKSRVAFVRTSSDEESGDEAPTKRNRDIFITLIANTIF